MVTRSLRIVAVTLALAGTARAQYYNYTQKPDPTPEVQACLGKALGDQCGSDDTMRCTESRCTTYAVDGTSSYDYRCIKCRRKSSPACTVAPRASAWELAPLAGIALAVGALVRRRRAASR
jgi:hypothetical protein